MWELDHKEGWMLKNQCFWNVLEKTLESPLDSRDIKSVNPEENQPWTFIGRTDVEAEAPNFGQLMQRANLFEKTLMLGKIEGRRTRRRQRKRWLDGIIDSMDLSLGVGDKQRSQVCCSPWGLKESDMTEQLNNNCLPWTIPDVEDTKKLAQSVLEEQTI